MASTQASHDTQCVKCLQVARCRHTALSSSQCPLLSIVRVPLCDSLWLVSRSSCCAGMIIFLVPIVGALTTRFAHFDMIHLGSYLSALSPLWIVAFPDHGVHLDLPAPARLP